jgi:hypothetical protein
MRIFFSRWIQPIHQWVAQMWLYLGPSCPYRPFSEELGEVEINIRIYKVLDHGADPNLGANPTPLREGVDITRVSPFAFTFGTLRSLIRSLSMCPVAGPCICSHRTTGRRGGGVTLPKDTMKREVNRAHDEKPRVRK